MSWILALSTEYLIGVGVWIVSGLLLFWGLLKWRQRRRLANKSLGGPHLGISIWFLLLLLTFFELYFALLFDTTDSFNMSNVSQVWFKRHVEPDLKALKFKAGRGVEYRDNEKFPEKLTDNQRHIVFIGDSFTFGHGVPDVEDRFTNRLRTLTHDKSEQQLIISNLAKPGTDLIWGNALLKELIETGQPVDEVVYVWCPNDIEAYHADHMELVNNLNAIEPSFFLWKHTYFLNFLYYRVQVRSVPKASSYYEFLADYYHNEPWDRFRDDFKTFAELCSENGIRGKVVLFPFLQDLDDSPFDFARQQVTDVCKQLDLPCLDLHERLVARASDRLTVSPFDAHPSELAHEIAAEAIAPFLKTNRLPESNSDEQSPRESGSSE